MSTVFQRHLPRLALRVVHRGLRHTRPHRREGALGGVRV